MQLIYNSETANSFIGYMKRSVDVMYDAYGSGAGIRNLFTSNGVYSYAATDYGLKDEDSLKNVPLTLSQEVLTGIFNGTIPMWNHEMIRSLNRNLTFPNASINVVVRNDTSGTTSMLASGLSNYSKEWSQIYGK